jgi:tetraacyldisaccharide 4'-kinase
MPVGLLRESKKGIKRADCVVISKCPENLTLEESNRIKKKLKFTKEVFFSKVVYDKIVSLNGNKTIKKSSIKKVLLVTGIANSSPIIDIYKREISEIIILTTEKDAQKMKVFEELSKFPVYYLKVSIDFIRNKDKFEEKILKYVKAHS